MKTKKVKGFTLIELIVVIAIIAVLAAILIPSLMGWVSKANISTANSNAANVAKGFQTVISDLETDGIIITSGTTYTADLTFSDSTVTAAEFKKKVVKAAGIKTTAKWGVEISSDGEEVLAAYYAKSDKDKYIGLYPTELTKDTLKSVTFSNAFEKAKEKAATPAE